MFDPASWMFWIVPSIVVVAVVWRLRPRTAALPKVRAWNDDVDPREDRLAQRLAGVVSCSVAQALPSVRREIDIAPHQSDETLFKRALYHYRQELPESACPAYRDSKPG